MFLWRVFEAINPIEADVIVLLDDLICSFLELISRVFVLDCIKFIKLLVVDNNFYEIVTSTQGVLEIQRYEEFIQETLGIKLINNTDWKNKISFYTSSKTSKEHSLKIIDNIEYNSIYIYININLE